MVRVRRAVEGHFGGLPAMFWWLWAGAFVCALATFVFPFLALFLTSRGFSPTRAGLFVSIYGAGILLAGPVAGILADHIGRRPTILGALVGSASAAAALAFLSSPPAIACVLLLFGIATAAVATTVQATMADVVPLDDRPRAFGLMYWANNIGIGVSLVLGGVLASYGWTVPFLADAATTLLFAIVVWQRVAETRPAAATAAPGVDVDARGGYGPVMRDRRFLAFLVVQVAFGIGFWQMNAALPIDMVHHGLSAAVFGSVLAVNTALIALVQPFSARATSRFTTASVLAVASLLVGIGFGSYAWCSTAGSFAVATGIWTFGEIAYMPTAGAFVTELAPADMRGRYSGAYALVFGISGFTAPIVGPAVMQAYGAPVLWAGCLASGMVVAAGQLVVARMHRPTSAPAA